jgi:hypothetical protein
MKYIEKKIVENTYINIIFGRKNAIADQPNQTESMESSSSGFFLPKTYPNRSNYTPAYCGSTLVSCMHLRLLRMQLCLNKFAYLGFMFLLTLTPNRGSRWDKICYNSNKKYTCILNSRIRKAWRIDFKF